MKKISLLVVVAVALVFVGCASKGVELEKSPCAFSNNIAISIEV